MKSAMQELIEIIKSKQIQCVNEWQSGYQKALNDILFDCKEVLEKEKEQIINAYNQADLDGYFQKTYPKYAEQYYNKTYNK
jgi:hypothetical protein